MSSTVECSAQHCSSKYDFTADDISLCHATKYQNTVFRMSTLALQHTRCLSLFLLEMFILPCVEDDVQLLISHLSSV